MFFSFCYVLAGGGGPTCPTGARPGIARQTAETAGTTPQHVGVPPSASC